MFTTEAMYFRSFQSSEKMLYDSIIPLKDMGKSDSEEQEESAVLGHGRGEQDWGTGQEVKIFQIIKKNFPTLRIVDTLQIAGTESGKLKLPDMVGIEHTIDRLSDHIEKKAGLTLLVVRKGLTLSNLIQDGKTKGVKINQIPSSGFRYKEKRTKLTPLIICDKTTVDQSYYTLITNAGLKALNPDPSLFTSKNANNRLSQHDCVKPTICELISLNLLTEFSDRKDVDPSDFWKKGYAVIPEENAKKSQNLVVVHCISDTSEGKRIQFENTNKTSASAIGCKRFI